MQVLTHVYDDIISVENLLMAWQEFIRGKRARKDVQEFQLRLMDNILTLHTDMQRGIYTHGPYEAFNITDPKPRNIHKARVRDRLVHHAIYRVLYPFFDRTFIADSYSCREGKGSHKALKQFTSHARKVSNNHTRNCWVLKCDICKFFASIDHQKLKAILASRIPDGRILDLLSNVIDSFHAQNEKGLPLGNLTSQLLVNIYMNEFDQYVEHILRAKHYIRYADDFVLLSRDRKALESICRCIGMFLKARLLLELHPKKVSIGTVAAGVDFLGWVHFTDHRVLRTVTKRRMLRRITERGGEAMTVQSYVGLMRHGNAQRTLEKIRMVVANKY